MISIIIPVYNKEKYIIQTIQSIEQQTYSNYEIVIVNDGSEDKSLEICEKLAQKNNKIKIINQQNQGPSEARNTGIKNSNGEKIVFIDADDNIEKDYLEKLVKESDKYELTICGYKLIKDNKTIINRFSDKQEQEVEIKELILILKKNLLNNLWNKIFKADIIKENNIKFIPKISLGEDTLFVLEYLKHVHTKIKVINLPLYNYTLKQSGINISNKESLTERIERILYTKKKMEEIYKLNKIDDKISINDEFILRIIPIMARYLIKNKNNDLLEIRSEIKEIIRNTEMKEMLQNTRYKLLSFLLKRRMIILAYILIKMRRDI